MQVVILAAGKGERLGPLTRDIPKSLLQIAEGLTLLESQILSIRQAENIQEILLVVGHLAEQIEERVKSYTLNSMPIRTIYNPFYEVSNNLVSLWLALPYCGEDFIVVNGDDVFNPVVLCDLIDLPGEREIVMVVDRKDKYDNDDMKVCTDGVQAIEISKEVAPERANAESIGMIMFRGLGSHKLKSVLGQLVRQEEERQSFWLRSVQQIIDGGMPVYVHECAREDWAEIDFHPDLEVVRSKIHSDGDILRRWFDINQTLPDR